MERETIVAHAVTAARQVFKVMLGIDIQPGQDYVENNSPRPSEGVLALIGLGGAWMGTGMLTCPPGLACKIAGAMLLTEYPAVNEDVLDAMGEMSNMIFGHMKTEIEEELGVLCLSMPTVVYGRNFATKSISRQPYSVVPLVVGAETLELRICLTPNQQQATSLRQRFSLHHEVS